MSLIAYFNRALVADTSAVNFNTSNPDLSSSPGRMRKLWLSKDSRIAVATTGFEVDYDSAEFLAWIKYVKKAIKEAGTASKIKIPKPFRSNNWLFLTSEAGYELLGGGEEELEEVCSDLIKLSDNFPHFNGSGRDTASFITAAKPSLTALQVFALTAEVCPSMWGTDFDIVEQCQLKPL